MLTPLVPLEAAEPPYDAAVAAPPVVTTQPVYVYLSRVLIAELEGPTPSAKMPTVLLPAAEPP